MIQKTLHHSIIEKLNPYSVLQTSNMTQQQVDVGRGVTIALDVVFLVFATTLSILIPILYYFCIHRRHHQREHHRDDSSSQPNLDNSQCGCSKTSWKNFILSLPLGERNALAFINENGSFALFQSTWFHIVIFRIGGYLNRKHDEIEKKQKLYNIACWLSTFWILFLRLCCIALGVSTAYYVGSRSVSIGETWLKYTQFLTNNSFNVFIVFMIFVTFSHVIYLCIVIGAAFRNNNSLFPYFDQGALPKWMLQIMHIYGDILWILVELNLVTATVVSLGFWLVLAPTSSDTSRFGTFNNLSVHAFTWIISMIETFNSDFYLKFWHIFLVGMFCPCYLLFIIGLRENYILNNFPYGALLDYYQSKLAPIMHLVLMVVYYLFFAVYWTVYTVLKKQAVVWLSDKDIKDIKLKK
ncbi:hypothetical protein FDP41_003979 [Naegleria fowleri]|uniref:Uncharacterized protein n=1 Tax=Naegleria fowleri TaxID=5763 RepID=A0A6A5BR89_NAEFO|nr:uncharacterized protein FDP41_003979 [Naegleria fowleri]KAF0976684.1 hypothetical protein FDP41_003979 [Naegleria fowleri]CAG4709801.1 unnamed protein product [Naegleria fowleri]